MEELVEQLVEEHFLESTQDPTEGIQPLNREEFEKLNVFFLKYPTVCSIYAKKYSSAYKELPNRHQHLQDLSKLFKKQSGKIKLN